MNYLEILSKARQRLMALDDNLIDVLDIKRPTSFDYARNLAKVISKLSPLIGNMIEFAVVDFLNEDAFYNVGKWIRQDLGFPDALFKSKAITPNPGIEIKVWFPFATEITARFRESITILKNNSIDMALIAWLPENVIWGRPKIIDIIVISGKSVAEARDLHYHNPPNYIVFEPEDTSGRTSNLRQINTNGYKLQQDRCSLEEANAVVKAWGEKGKAYNTSQEYQRLLHTLYGRFIYRLDTNYAKIDRIGHVDIELFKTRVLNTTFHGKSIKEWSMILASNDDKMFDDALQSII